MSLWLAYHDIPEQEDETKTYLHEWPPRESRSVVALRSRRLPMDLERDCRRWCPDAARGGRDGVC